jgi:hypothetical protein
MERHTDLAMLREVFVDWDGNPWIAVTRSAEEVIAEAEPLGWRALRVDREAERLFGVVTIERTPEPLAASAASEDSSASPTKVVGAS